MQIECDSSVRSMIERQVLRMKHLLDQVRGDRIVLYEQHAWSYGDHFDLVSA
jgi:hypothetical protein